jgi:hypothetical protein
MLLVHSVLGRKIRRATANANGASSIVLALCPGFIPCVLSRPVSQPPPMLLGLCFRAELSSVA